MTEGIIESRSSCTDMVFQLVKIPLPLKLCYYLPHGIIESNAFASIEVKLLIRIQPISLSVCWTLTWLTYYYLW